MITGWITHRPNKVIIKKYAKCLRVLLPVPLNVKVLLAKKLKTNATEVDIKLLTIAGIPKATNVNRITKSIEVFMPPTRPKRNFSACFFRSFCIVTFLNKIKWATFYLFKDTADVFTYNPQ